MLKPLNKKVLVRRDKEKTMSDGGIHLAPSAQQKPLTGIILDVAANCEVLKAENVGTKVMFPKFAGAELELENEEGKLEKLLILKETELVGLL